MVLLRTVGSLIAVAALSIAAPLDERAIGDAPISTPASTIEAAIKCPNGIKGKKGGIVFLVHGTGSTGAESWASGPYVKALPNAGKGYDVCWVDLPGRSTVDAQKSAEYVAYGIKYLAPKSSTGKVSILGHSQGGGLNPQWALVFWPSTQRLVQQYIALAGDFKGTVSGKLLCNGVTPCAASVWQQTIGSKYLAAQNSQLPGGGGRALVPTTSIYTTTDEIVTPQFPPVVASSNLPGSYAHALQDLDYCGVRVSDHFTIIIDPAAYGLARQTLDNGAPLSSLATFDKTFCLVNKDAPGVVFTGVPMTLQSVFNDAVAVGTQSQQTSEPPLQPYVCQRGFAPAGSCGAAF